MDGFHPVRAGRHFHPAAVFRPYVGKREGLDLFLHGQKLGKAAFILQSSQRGMRDEQRIQKGLLDVARPDDPGRYAVDGSVKIIRADDDAVQRIAGHDLTAHFLQRIIQRDDMVTVPPHAARQVQRYLIAEQQQGG